jgi:iron complex outermembrane receptor protein
MKVYLIAFATLITFSVKAQMPAGMQANPKMATKFASMMSIGKVYGKVLDASSKKPVPFANVTVKNAKDSIISGTFTKENGDFAIDKLPLGKIKVIIKNIGYEPISSDVALTFNNAEQEMGDFYIKETAQSLSEVTVSAERAGVELKLDRKVVNVDKDLSSKGGTALDIMKNVPGVNVSTDDEVTLRNGTPTIYVDGRPTTLQLRQIPADQIQSVEVITNPSAKFEASAQGGILNVVMKKNNKPGYNGIVNLSAGTNNQFNAMGLLNLKEKHFGVNLSYNTNGNKNTALGYSNTESFRNGQIISSTNQDINSVFKRHFQFARLGFDFFLTNRNTLSVSGNLVDGNFNTNELQNSLSTKLDSSFTGNRTNLQTIHFQNLNGNLNFKHTFPKQGKEYSFDFTYSKNKGGNVSDYLTNKYYEGAEVRSFPELQTLNNNNGAGVFTGQWDFTNPLENDAKLEFGTRVNSNQSHSMQDVSDFDSTSNAYIHNSVLSNNYKVSDMVAAAYVTYGKKINQLSYQLGLRYESSWYKTTLLDKNQEFSYTYPHNVSTIQYTLFPSFNTSYKLNTENEFQFNLSRKINRPNFFQNSPFRFASDQTGYRIGNPELKPEFINKTEINHSVTVNGYNLLTSLYANYNQDPITTYTYQDALGLLVTTFDNAKYAYSYGIEPTLRITKIKNLDITLNTNVYYIKYGSIGSFTGGNDGWSFNSKATFGYKLPFKLNFQLNGNYNAPRVIPQGHIKEVYFADASLSKDMGLISFNLTLSDIFNSRRMASYVLSDNYSNDQSRRRDVRFLRFGISIRFGKMDASLFKMKKKGGDMPNMNMGDGF